MVAILALCPPAGHGPLALAFAGLPGAGKSELARRLALASGWSLVDRDEIREQAHPGDASEAVRVEADRQLYKRVGIGLRVGLNLIVDGKTFARRHDRMELEEIAADAGGRVLWCLLDVPIELAIARVQAQGDAHPARDRDETLVRDVAARFEPLSGMHWRLDAACTPDELEQELIRQLSEHLRAMLFEE